MSRAPRLLHITDTHLFARPDGELRGVVTRDTLAAVLTAARAQALWPPTAVLATGDLSEDESALAYAAFADMLSPLGVPVHCLPGNHDDPVLMRDSLTRAPFTLCATPEFDDWRVIMLSSRIHGSPGGRLGPEELARLATQLETGTTRHVLVCVHHQPRPMGSRWLDRHMLADAQPFGDIIAAHPQVRGVLWGHVHQAYEQVHDGVLWMSTPSTCDQFLPGSDTFATDSKPPAWRWLTLQPDGRIETQLCWLGTS